jgi:hypothetical protein
LEQIRGGVAFSVKTVYVRLCVGLRAAEGVMFVQQHVERIRKAIQFLTADGTEKCTSISAVIQPVILLSRLKSRRPMCNLVENRLGYFGRNVRANIGEVRIELACGASVGDAPRTELARKIARCIDRTDIDVASRFAARYARDGGGFNRSRRHRVRVVAKRG